MAQNNFRKLFPDPRRKIFLPVIHLTDSRTEIFEVGKAVTDGDADGACLICHTGSVDRVIEAYYAIRETYTLPIILNFLGQEHPLSILEERLMKCPPEGLWTDEGFREPSLGDYNTPELNDFYQWSRQRFPNMFLARTISFKHQQLDYPSGIEDATRRGMRYMDLVVTSGPRTGYPPEPKKIQTMQTVLQGYPLAIASGITQKNLYGFQAETDCFMVSSGLCETPDTLSPRLLREFAACLRAGT